MTATYTATIWRLEGAPRIVVSVHNGFITGATDFDPDVLDGNFRDWAAEPVEIAA